LQNRPIDQSTERLQTAVASICSSYKKPRGVAILNSVILPFAKIDTLTTSTPHTLSIDLSLTKSSYNMEIYRIVEQYDN